jgi:hypothetical protein
MGHGARRGRRSCRPPCRGWERTGAAELTNQTLRQIVLGAPAVLSIAVFSNAFGHALPVGAASIAVRDKGRRLCRARAGRFSSAASHPRSRLAPCSQSDPVTLNRQSRADAAVDLYLPGDSGNAITARASHRQRGTADQLRIRDR